MSVFWDQIYQFAWGEEFCLKTILLLERWTIYLWLRYLMLFLLSSQLPWVSLKIQSAFSASISISSLLSCLLCVLGCRHAPYCMWWLFYLTHILSMTLSQLHDSHFERSLVQWCYLSRLISSQNFASQMQYLAYHGQVFTIQRTVRCRHHLSYVTSGLQEILLWRVFQVSLETKRD